MWAYHGIFYQIYPIGFCGAPVHNDGICTPRIRKLLDWSEYLENLGVDSILLNPVFESDNHGYDTRDFKKIDCRLGTNEDFAQVCQDLHRHHVKVVLDGVFNHVGRGFWAFQDVLEKRWDSPYKDWFLINFDGNNGYNDGLWYEGWEGHFELVKLNLKNPAVTDYLLECGVLNLLQRNRFLIIKFFGRSCIKGNEFSICIFDSCSVIQDTFFYNRSIFRNYHFPFCQFRHLLK